MITRPASAWVRNRQAHYHPRGTCLSPADTQCLAPYHDADLISRARICRVALHLRNIQGITYGDVILIAPDAPSAGPGWLRLLFHEMVHVVQYRVLGIDRFIEQYLRGWARGGYEYRKIPLEEDAYAIEAMFTAGAGRPFSVQAEVEHRLAARAAADHGGRVLAV